MLAHRATKMIGVFALVLGASSTLALSANASNHHHHHHHHARHHSVNPSGIPQHNGGDGDADNNGGPSDGDGNM